MNRCLVPLKFLGYLTTSKAPKTATEGPAKISPRAALFRRSGSLSLGQMGAFYSPPQAPVALRDVALFVESAATHIKYKLYNSVLPCNSVQGSLGVYLAVQPLGEGHIEWIPGGRRSRADLLAHNHL